MTVEFFGIRGFGQIGGIKKTDRPGEAQKTDKTTGTRDAGFSQALQNAQTLQGLENTQNAERAARVQALKEQVANGTYEPDLQKVATSLLKFLVEER